MSQIKKTKNIICYFCKKTKGVAKRVLKFTILGGGKNRKKTGKWIWTWKAKGFKMFDSNVWLCDSCSRNQKCESCGIALSNFYKCRCGVKHGAFYLKHPKHCKECWDRMHPKKI